LDIISQQYGGGQDGLRSTQLSRMVKHCSSKFTLAFAFASVIMDIISGRAFWILHVPLKRRKIQFILSQEKV
jgi:hypothetical protein